jgi:hypothetical protein
MSAVSSTSKSWPLPRAVSVILFSCSSACPLRHASNGERKHSITLAFPHNPSENHSAFKGMRWTFRVNGFAHIRSSHQQKTGLFMPYCPQHKIHP